MYLNGTEKYIEETVKKYSPSMLRASYAILKNKDDAEDAVQEAFMKLIYKEPTFNDENHEKAWLLRVTINISKNMLKSSYRKNELYSEPQTAESSTDEVLPYVFKLNERYRTVIHLYYYEDYSIKEIASILKIPAATVGTRLSRGKMLLKNMLEGDFDL